MKRLANLCISVCLSIVSLGSLQGWAHEYRTGAISIEHPWSRATPPGAAMGVAYMVLDNTGNTEVRLVSAETPRAARVSIHRSHRVDGLMRMEHLPDGLVIPAGEKVELQPQGYHLMLEKLNGALKAGERVPMTLNFQGADPVVIELAVQAPGVEKEESGDAGHHEGMGH